MHTMTDYRELASPRSIKDAGRASKSVLHLNARSVVNKKDEISIFLSDFSFKFDIILLSETWYHDSCNMLRLPGYELFYLNRVNKRGGGVAAMVASGTHCNLVTDFTKNTEDYEVLVLHSKNEIFCVVYRPPDGNIVRFLDFFEGFLEYVAKNNFRLVCAGDFNINVLEQSTVSRDLNLQLQSCGFVNLITTPTRITSTTLSAIDLFLTNVETKILTVGTLSCDISDHCPIFCIYNTDINKNNELGDVFTFQSITELGLALFKLEVERYDWSSVFEKTTADDAYNCFLEIFLRLYEKCFPLKTVRRSKKVRKPWVSLEHLKMIKHKNSLYHSFQRTQSEVTLKEFKKLRNNINKKLRLAKATYYQNLFADASQKRPASTWNIINKILGRNNTSSYPSAITHDSVELTGKSLAEHFNHYFTNIVSPSANILNIMTKQSGPVQSIFLTPTDETEIYSTFMNIRNSTATDIDHLQIKPIKYVLSSISRILTHIFNLVLETGIFPTNMKKAKVSVIYKSGDKNLASNYRPISVLPVFSKGLEKIISSRVTMFLEKNNILTDFQFGFRKGKSTETALLAIKENVLQNIQNNLYTVGVFIDLSKAFDCINHNILINKLSNIGIRGSALSLFDSYLRNRSQCVCIHDHKSSFL